LQVAPLVEFVVSFSAASMELTIAVVVVVVVSVLGVTLVTVHCRGANIAVSNKDSIDKATAQSSHS
jgi:hypothetical protein